MRARAPRPPAPARSARTTKTRARPAGDRGQAHTLEAVAAAMLLLSSLVFALQVTAVTPLTGSTSSQHIENQQGATAEGLLDAEAANGSLTPALLYWNASGGRFWGATDDGYPLGGPPATASAFGPVLNETFRDRGIAFNVNVYHLRGDGDRARVPLVHFGVPSDHATVATRTVTLRDGDRLRAADGSPGQRLDADDDNYLAKDVDPDGPLYNVLEVEVVVWRM